MCISTHTKDSLPPLGYCTQAQLGIDKRSPSLECPLRITLELYILLKEEGAGEKKKAGVWSVITLAFIPFSPLQT